MVEYTKVSRKTTNEDRIATCPQLGCDTMKRVKPLKLGFFGFGKYPKCKQHHLPLVYIDERIGEIVDGALACLFDKAGLPPKMLLRQIKQKYPQELNTFINSWIYCITIGRGASIISSYMDSLSKSYLKQITKKQLKILKDDLSIKIERKKEEVFNAIKRGIDEITLQYTRLLKHLRAHSEMLVNTQKILNLSPELRNMLTKWLQFSSNIEMELLKIEEKQNIPLSQVKDFYDRILNLDTGRCLLGHSANKRISVFDRFSAYLEFWKENLTKKFTRSDIEALKTNEVLTVITNEYSTLSFLNDLKGVLAKNVSENKLWRGKLTDEQLSLILGQSKSHIRKKRNQIKKNSNYLISIEKIEDYESNIKKNLVRVPREIINLLNKYKNSNNLKKSLHGIYRWHPNLKIDYFEYIDTKEKAYWLGWLFAEGWLSKHDKYLRFGVELHKDDEKDLLDKFARAIGFNLEHKETEIRRDGEITDYVRIRFVSDEFAKNLIKHGFIVGKKKSKSIELPKLASRELYLAFILGYYDGDGKVGSTVITSGSINFINQVRRYFKITHKIWRTDSEWDGVGYNIYLGMDLMREMLKNYRDSLERKKMHFK